MRRVAVAIEILVLRAAATQGTLPQLAQVGVDIVTAVTGPIQAIAQRAASTGAIARRRLRAAIAGPHEPILFVVTKVLRFTAPGITVPGTLACVVERLMTLLAAS